MLKGPCCKRCEIKWVARLSVFDRYKSSGYDDLTAKHFCFRTWPPDVDGIKIFDKDDQAKTLR